MPLTVRVYEELALIWVEGSGVVSDADLKEYVEEFLVKRGLREYDEIFDLSQADLLDITYLGLSRVASAAAPTDPEDTSTRIAILVSETVGLGISRMYQTIRETKGGRRNLRIFRDFSPLRDWMGLPADWTEEGR